MAETKKTAASKAKKPAAKKAPEAPAAKERFARALDEARAGTQALGKDAQARAGAYREQLAGASAEWLGEAKNASAQVKDRALDLAGEGKAKATDAISSLGKIVADSAAVIDEKVGAQYGDYARSAAKNIQDAAAKLEAKDLGELGNDAKEFVRKSPGIAIGIAAVAGFFIARALSGKQPEE